MGVTAATLNGNRVTHATAWLPKWGCWYADASIDGEVTLSGRVSLVINDLTLQGAVLSGGAAKGRSMYRIIGGRGGWHTILPELGYGQNDAGVKLSLVLGDAANECGEVVEGIPATKIGPSFTRDVGPASRLLEHFAPGNWYVGEDGITRIGARPVAPLAVAATLGQVDRGRGMVTLAAESIKSIVPGVVVDGLEAVDVIHEISATDGLRSTIYGAQGGASSRRLAAWRRLHDQLDPDRRFGGVTEYRVVTRSGRRLNLQPVRVSSGMPNLRSVPVRPGVAGCDPTIALGARVLVAFVDRQRERPAIVGFEEVDGSGFVPSVLNFRAAGQVGGEHLATVEGMTVFIHNVIFGLAALGLPASWLASGAIATVINAALAASNAPPAPPTKEAQLAAAGSMASAMLTGPGTSSSPYAAAIAAALETKIPNESGLFPSIGSAGLEGG